MRMKYTGKDFSDNQCPYSYFFPWGHWRDTFIQYMAVCGDISQQLNKANLLIYQLLPVLNCCNLLNLAHF